MECRDNLTEYGECRCCLSKGNHRDLHKEYQLNGRREVFYNVLTECFNLFLSTEPSLTTQICSVCIKRLRDAQRFRTLVVENEKRLLDTLGAQTDTEFVNVVFDPLVDDETVLKTEIKLESVTEYNEDEQYDVDTESEDMVPGEKELIGRFSSVKALPTRDSLIDTCPMFCGHLDALKGKVIEANTIADVVKTPEHRKSRNRTRNLAISEKMAYTLNAVTLLEHSNATVFKSKMRSGFPCFYCRTIFDNPKTLREHQSKHPKNQLFKLLTKYSANAIIVYADVTDLKCTICDEDIESITKLKEHLVNKHNKKLHDDFSDRVIPFKLGDRESNFECQVCGINFETFGAIDRHMNVHYKNFVCEECGSWFITKHRLKVHTYVRHQKSDGVISCEGCNKIFQTKHRYKIHYENVHKKLKKMQCSKCPEKFIDYFTRQRHMEETHGTEPILYKCSECERSFNRKYSLTCHFKRRHLVNRDVQCEMCPFMCFTKSELREHMYKHSGGKSFVCSVCKKAFTRKKTLTTHMRIHSNDLRYSCHLCGETFVHNWSLKSHLRSHNMEYDV